MYKFLVVLIALGFFCAIPATMARDNCAQHATEGYRCVQGFGSTGGCPTGEQMGDFTCSNGQWCCKQAGVGPTAGAQPVTVNVGPDNGPTDMYGLFVAVLAKLQSIIGYLSLIFIVIGAVLYILSGVNENFKKAANACITGALIGLALAAAAPTFLLEIKQMVFSGAVPTTIEQIPTVKSIVMRALGLLLSIVGALAIMGLVISGLMYITAYGNKSQADKAHKAMTYSIIGIVIASLSLILVRQIVQLITG